jgi:hypothetical protein
VPVRFQVDPDFYDHPKTLGMSDAAVSLWVRAGSYSVAKTTDGFVSEDVLVHALRSTVEVAEELVQRGMWRRRKGGFQFHQWEARNLTKDRIEADRQADRDRKRITRRSGQEDENRQVNMRIVRPDTGRTPNGIRAESGEIPGASVSVSESVSHPPRPPKGGRRLAYDYGGDDLFARFWSAFPQKSGKPAAFKAWAAALKRGADPERIIRAAARYRDDPKRNPDKTKYPQGWLNDERYLDEPATYDDAPARGWWDN